MTTPIRKTQPTEEGEQIREPKNYRNDIHCWRSFCADLIHAAAFGAEHYAFQADRRLRFPLTGERRARAVANGQQIHEHLLARYPDIASPLVRAMTALGENIGGKEQLQQRDATLSALLAWLPRRPPTEAEREREERDRRMGTSDEQRQEQAEALARAMIPDHQEQSEEPAQHWADR